MRGALWICCLLGLAAGCASEDPYHEPTPIVAASPFVYPLQLWDEGIEGETIVLLHVDTEGMVDSVFVSHSSGRAEFDSAAVAGARKLQFVPGRRGSRRVESWVKLPVRFAQNGDAVAAGVAVPAAAAGGGQE